MGDFTELFFFLDGEKRYTLKGKIFGKMKEYLS